MCESNEHMHNCRLTNNCHFVKWCVKLQVTTKLETSVVMTWWKVVFNICEVQFYRGECYDEDGSKIDL